jgi:hypothetical protein
MEDKPELNPHKPGKKLREKRTVNFIEEIYQIPRHRRHIDEKR